MKLILKYLARLMIWKYNPKVVAVTGSIGKTSAIQAIYAVLSFAIKDEKNLRVRASKSFFKHSDFGVPLAILGDFKDEELRLATAKKLTLVESIKKIIFGIKIIFLSLFKIFIGPKDKNYPEILILEYGSRAPKKLKYLLDIAKPDVGIITAIGEIPAHVGFWNAAESLIKEKGKIIEYLSSGGFAVLNFDDNPIISLKERTRAKVITFGFEEGADLRITNFDNRIREGRPEGVSFKINYGGSSVPIIMNKVFGKAEAYAGSIAAAVGLIFDLNLVEISEALLRNYEPCPDAITLVPGIKNTSILNSSSNASPTSVEEALNILEDLPGERKIAVLGDMLELGKYTLEAHESIGALAKKSADILVTVGPRGKFIANGAVQAGLSKNKVLSYDTVTEAGLAIQDLMKKGDLILIKASKEMGLNEVVEEIKAAPITSSVAKVDKAPIV